jgi:AraC-like DNA-binding protein
MPVHPSRQSDATPTAQKLERWHDVVCRALVPMTAVPSATDGFDWSLATQELGRLTINDITSTPHDVYRTSRHVAQDDKRFLQVGLLLHGRCTVEQHGRQASLTAGDLVCYDTAAPYAFHMHTPFRLIVVLMPAPTVEHRLRGFESVTATTFTGSQGLASLAGGLVRRVADDSGPYAGPSGIHVGDAVTDLVAGLVSERIGEAPDEDAARAALRARVHRFIELNLADPDLSPPVLASAVGVSLRYLYKLFEDETSTVSAFIRDRRLDQVARDLADPRLQHRTIAAIAAQWGFLEAAHFSRAFRAREGISPREFRHRSLTD